MKPARAFLQLVASVFLVAALVVSSGFAATKKLDRHRSESQDWNDSSLMSTILLSTGSSVPSDGGSASLSIGSLEAPSLVLNPGTPDNWDGGIGNWSNAGNWSAGAPGAGSDVTIYSGGNDTVTLDTSPTISSLVLGGASNGTTSELTDGGVAQSLTITNGLTVGQTGFLDLEGASTVSAGTLNNSGYVIVGAGATLNLTNQLGGITDVVAGSRFDILGSFNEGMGINNGFEHLTGIEGLAILGNGAISTITPNGGTLTIANGGQLDVDRGTIAVIFGNVSNSGNLTTGQYYGGGSNVIDITGALTNAGNFWLTGNGDVANVQGTFTNTGYTYVGPGATLDLFNQPNVITDVVAGSRFDIYGAFTVAGANALANLTSVEGTVNLFGQNMAITPSGGTFTIAGGGQFVANYDSTTDTVTTLTVNGDVNNSGLLGVGIYNNGQNNVTITGNLTNQGNVELDDRGGDTLAIGGNLTNAQGANVYLLDHENLQVGGNFNNAGLLQTGGNGVGANTVTVGGNMTNQSTGTVALYGPGDLLQINGADGFTNYGLVNVDNGSAIDPVVLKNGGTINIDGSSKMVVGSVGMAGQGYTQLANGTLGEIITSANNFGVINITGAANLAGTLNIMLASGYDPANGTMFKFLNFTPGMLSGSFGTVFNQIFNGGSQQFVLDYNSGLGFVELVAEPTSTNVDYWLGGSGNWSNNGQWSLTNYPTITNDAVIYSDIANDLVTLDLGSASVNSLSIGGSDLTYYSELTDGGTMQTLTITNGLTIGTSGELLLTGGSTVTVGSDSSNAGKIGLFNGSMFSITGNFNNSNSGIVDLESSSQLQVAGNVSNSGLLETAFYHNGGNTLNIGGTLTNNPTGYFYLFGNGDVANVGMVDNSGHVVIEPNATLNLTNEPGGVTDALAGSFWGIYGNFAVAGVPDTGFANLTTVEGEVDFGNDLTTNVTPIGGTLTVSKGGHLDVSYSNTALVIDGDVNNSGTVSMNGYDCCGGATLTIEGTLTNNSGAALTVNGPIIRDLLNVEMLVNSGNVTVTNSTINVFGDLTNNPGAFLDLESGGTLNVAGNVNNSAGNYIYGIVTGFSNTSGNTVNIGGTLTNSGWFLLLGNGDMATIGNGVVNSGLLDAEGGSTLQINGNVDNTGIVSTNWLAFRGGGDTLNITGTLTNEAGGRVEIYGPGSVVTVSSLTNAGEVDDVYGSSLQTGNVPNSGVFFVNGGSLATMTSLANSISGFVDVEQGSTLQVNGDVTNAGGFFTNYYDGVFTGGNVVNITGALTNSGTFELNGVGDMATLGNLDNNSGANVTVNNGSSLIVNGNVNNAGNIVTDPGGNTITISGMLTNSGVFELSGPGDMASIGSLKNSGFVDVEHGGTFQVNGDALNTGYMATDYQGFGGGNKVNITGTLNNQGGNTEFVLNGPNDMASLGGLTNSGFVDVTNGSTLQINGNAANFGALLTGEFGNGGNKLTITGNLTNDINSFGTFGSGDMLTIGGSVTNGGGLILLGAGSAAIMGTLSSTGLVDVSNGSSLQINGDVSNSGEICTNCANGFYSPGNRIAVTGTLTNAAGGQIYIGYYYNSNDSVTVGNGFVNSGLADVEGGSTLQITGNATNAGTLETDYVGYGGSNALNIGGNLTNSGTFQLNGPGDAATIGSVVNSGFIDLENNSTLTVTGDVNNSGNIYTSDFGGSGHNTITIDGELTFSPTGQVALLNPTDKLVINGGGSIELLHGAALSTPTLNNGGTINVDSLSTLLVGLGSFHGPSENYTQLANGTLTEMISSPTSFGVINVSGSALLDGTLAILLQRGFTPADGSLFKFLIASPGELSGVFSDVPDTRAWKLIYDYADGYVEAEFVPEPATLLVLIPGLLGMGYGLRRKLLG